MVATGFLKLVYGSFVSMIIAAIISNVLSYPSLCILIIIFWEKTESQGVVEIVSCCERAGSIIPSAERRSIRMAGSAILESEMDFIINLRCRDIHQLLRYRSNTLQYRVQDHR